MTVTDEKQQPALRVPARTVESRNGCDRARTLPRSSWSTRPLPLEASPEGDPSVVE